MVPALKRFDMSHWWWRVTSGRSPESMTPGMRLRRQRLDTPGLRRLYVAVRR